MLGARGIDKAFGSRVVLRGLDLVVEAGGHTLVSGPSGSGKSTLIHLLARLVDPDAGELQWEGSPVGGRAAAWRLAHVGLVFQEVHLLESLTVLQNLDMVARGAGCAVDPGLLVPLGLADRAGDPVRVLSRGERQRVALARAFSNRPRLLLADEPTASLDPAQRDQTLDHLFELCERLGTTAVVVSHDSAVAERAEWGQHLWLEGGRLQPARST